MKKDKRTCILAYRDNVFRASFSTSINHSNPNGIVDISEVGNDALKTLVIQIKIK